MFARFRSKLAVFLGMSALLILSALMLDSFFPPNMARLENLSVAVKGEEGNLLRVFSTPDGLLRLDSKVEDVDPKYLRFLISYEDKRYNQHFGVDPMALARATWQWVTSGQVVSGGSTLTMQVARLLEPRARTISSKLLEILRSLQLEWHYSKQEILNIYLSLAPFGGRVEGIKSASLTYFQKSPKNLTIAQAALLTVLPQSPSRLRPERFPIRAKKARKKVLSRLFKLGIISKEEFLEAHAEPIPHKQHPVPLLAPHLSEQLVKAHPLQTSIETTLSAPLQAQVQDLVEAYAKTLGPQVSAAVIVVQNKDRTLKVHVGSNNYLDKTSHGFIDMTKAVRSPGSTLKPLIYALSFNDRQTHPQTLILDEALSDQSYRPTNFDKTNHGQVTLADALRFSLNIPAVKVLNRFGPIRFSETLKNHAISLRLPHENAKPNLAIALGGVGVTLEELVRIYSALASDRKICPLVFEKKKEHSPCTHETEIITPQVQTWIKGILQNTPRPVGYAGHQSPENGSIAFKTGTSYGYRDAWSVGFTEDYSVGVWVGAASGQSLAGQTGLKTAAPLLFSIFEKLPMKKSANLYATNQSWKNPAPENLKLFKDDQLENQIGKTAQKLEILYPLNETTLAMADIAAKGVLLQAQNGKRPLTWLVNDIPLTSGKWERKTRWQPEGPGFYKITVLDKNANRKSEQIEIK